MNREDIIRMAREAGLDPDLWNYTDAFERFAALVASAERDKHKWDIHSCSPTCNRYACVATREAVLAEREACIELVAFHGGPVDLEAAIRARGQA